MRPYPQGASRARSPGRWPRVSPPRPQPGAVLVEHRQLEIEIVLAEDSVRVERRHIRTYGRPVSCATGLVHPDRPRPPPRRPGRN